MELRYYLRIVRRWWWLAAIPIVGVTALGVFLTRDQPKVYESDATFVVRPRVADGADAARATDFLVRSADIPPTIAQIARSDAVRSAAAARLPGGGQGVRGSISVDSNVVAGTTILTISAGGPDPEMTRAYVSLLAEETIAYIESLDYVFTLSPLDQPSLARSPADNGRSVAIAGSVVLGLLLAALVVFLAEYLRQPREQSRSFDILDPLTGLNNEAFFDMRFEQELSRAQRTGTPFTVAMVHVLDGEESGAPAAQEKDVQMVAALLALCARPEDVLAHLGNGTIAALLPGSEEPIAEELADRLRRMVWPATGGVPPPLAPFSVQIGLCQYGGDSGIGRVPQLVHDGEARPA